MLSRITAAISERARNLFVDGASDELLEAALSRHAANGPYHPGDRVRLGGPESEIQASRLALGTGSNGWSGSSNQTRRLGRKGIAQLFRHAFDEYGVNFWDSADQYGSHPHLAEALRYVDRSEVVILTKTVAESAQRMKADLDRFRRELDTDYIDVLLLHCMTDRDWPERMRGVMDVISQAQQDGIVRLKGVSCHSFAALQRVPEEPWVDLDLARINPGGQAMDASPNQVVPTLRLIHDAGKTVMGMKIVGNGRLVSEKELCMKFALGLDCVDCFTMGFESVEQLDQIVSLITT